MHQDEHKTQTCLRSIVNCQLIGSIIELQGSQLWAGGSLNYNWPISNTNIIINFILELRQLTGDRGEPNWRN